MKANNRYYVRPWNPTKGDDCFYLCTCGRIELDYMRMMSHTQISHKYKAGPYIDWTEIMYYDERAKKQIRMGNV